MTTTHRPLAVVTGASSGIGRAIADELVEHGYDLVVAAEDGRVQDTARELSGRGCDVVAVQADLSTREGVDRLHDEVAATGRPVRAGVLNAGIANGGDFADSDLDADLRLVDLNCRGTVHLAKHLVREMAAAGEGMLLFTSSVAAGAPGPYQATYAASKAFVQSFAASLRHELRETGVTVTTLVPGPTDTEIFDRGGLRGTRLGEGGKKDPAEVAREAYRGMVDGKAQVVTADPVMKAGFAASGNSTIPEQAGAAAVAHQTRPGSAD